MKLQATFVASYSTDLGTSYFAARTAAAAKKLAKEAQKEERITAPIEISSHT